MWYYCFTIVKYVLHICGYHDLWYDVKPYLDALHRAPELVRGFLEKILAPKQERTMNVQQRNRKRGQDMEL